MKTNNIFTKINLTFSILLVVATIYSQQNYLYEVKDTSTVNWTIGEEQRYIEIANDSITESLELININKVKDVIENDSIIIKYDSVEYTFQTQSIYTYSNNNYYWYGKHKGHQDTCGIYGVIKLYYDSLGHVGSMAFDTNQYRIQRLSEDYNVLQKLNKNAFTECGMESDTTELKGKNLVDRNRTWNGNCDIHVLFLYSASAIQDDPAIESDIRNAIEDANQALYNSTIMDHEAKFVLVGIEQTTWTESGNVSVDILTVIPTDPDIQNWANLYQPDVVVVSGADDKYPNDATLGRAFKHDIDLNDPNQSYAWVRSNVINNGSNIVPHEIFHLLGARHQQSEIYPLQSNDHPTYAHGY